MLDNCCTESVLVDVEGLCCSATQFSIYSNRCTIILHTQADPAAGSNVYSNIILRLHSRLALYALPQRYRGSTF